MQPHALAAGNINSLENGDHHTCDVDPSLFLKQDGGIHHKSDSCHCSGC